MTPKRTPWDRAGRWLTLAVVACFFLPFFGVSCNGRDVVHWSGADLVGGCAPGGVLTEALGRIESQSGEAGLVGATSLDHDPLAIAAMALAVAAAALAWVRSRRATAAALAVTLAGVLALGGLYVKAHDRGGELADQQAAQRAGGASGTAELHVAFETRVGFWLASLGLLACAALAGRSIRRGDAVDAAGPPGATPPGAATPQPGDAARPA